MTARESSTHVHPLAIRVMDEVGIELRTQTSKTFDRFLGEPWDYAITVCDSANERCPLFPGRATRIHWSFDDPSAMPGDADERLAAFRRVRDAIRARLAQWLATDVGRASA